MLKEIGGYNEGIFLEKDNVKDLQCAICLDVIRDCVETPCGHLFCEACIKDFLFQRSKDEQVCPMDQIPIDINRLTAVISNRRKILSSKVMCQHQYEQNQLKAQELEDGEDIKNNDEEKKLPNTDIIQCQWTGQLNKLHEHLTLNCILRSVICPYQKYGCHVDNLNPKTLETHLSDPNMILAHLTLITDAYQVFRK